MIFQENRTPDNLFQGLCTANGGLPGCNASGTREDLRGCIDLRECRRPDGALNSGRDWRPTSISTTATVDQSSMEPSAGAISSTRTRESTASRRANAPSGCGANVFGCVVPAINYSQFMYVYNTPVTNTDGSRGGLLDPYITLATTYGWANRMFQTHQGPSSRASVYFWRDFGAYRGRRRCGRLCLRE